MSAIPTIAEFMIGQPYTIQYDETCSAAEKFMNAHKIRHLPVVDGKKVMGILSDRDITLAHSVYKDRQFEGQILVKEVCLFDSCTVEETEPLDHVARLMAKKRLDAVVVVRNRVPVGIFTTTDACRLLADNFSNVSGKKTKGFWSSLFG